MAKEIEYNYICNYIPVEQPFNIILRGYIHVDKKKQVRISINVSKKTAKLCVKIMHNSNERDEFETPIDYEEGMNLFTLCDYKFTKANYLMDHPQMKISFNIYPDGLKTVELELLEGVKIEDIQIPDYVGESIDGKFEFSNYHYAGILKENLM